MTAKTKNSAPKKKTVAILYGGPSHEHDVSVITALQIQGALDTTTYTPLLVYISPNGHWYIGEQLKERSNYIFDVEAIKTLTPVTLDTNRSDGMQSAGRLLHTKKKLFQSPIAAEFDIVIPAFHGSFGEDGAIQGLLDQINIPYAGMRTRECAVFMDKIVSKHIFKGLGIKALPYAELKRKGQATILSEAEITDAMTAAKIEFPCILKPTHLGSSIGVAKVTNAKEVATCLANLFTLDDSAILEPFVDNLVEYNVSIHNFDGDLKLSAIERPKTTEELLDFKQKYLSGAGKTGDKLGGGSKSGAISEGMLSLTRELNPDLPKKMHTFIKKAAKTLTDKLPWTGAARIDFIGNSETNEIWINEINPFPGSASYFLWEAAPETPLLFTELLNELITEAIAENKKRRMPKDPVPKDARILKRSLSE